MITKSTPLKTVIELGKECKRCGYCCSNDSGFISKNEIKRLAKHFKLSEAKFTKKYLRETVIFANKVFKFKLRKQPFGSCIMLKDKSCSIQKIKPLHCRIGCCSKHGQELSAWFTLNYLVNPLNPESIRQYKLYIETGGKTIPGGELADLVKDKKTLNKILKYDILR